MDKLFLKKGLMMRDFAVLPHTADIKIRVYGKNKKELFRHALIGMFQSIQPKINGAWIENGRVVCRELPVHRTITLVAEDEIGLLVDFLSQALYLSDVYNEAYLDELIHTLSETEIYAVLFGARVSGFEVVEIKAVTYHDLEILHTSDGWQVDIVFDI